MLNLNILNALYADYMDRVGGEANGDYFKECHSFRYLETQEDTDSIVQYFMVKMPECNNVEIFTLTTFKSGMQVELDYLYNLLDDLNMDYKAPSTWMVISTFYEALSFGQIVALINEAQGIA